MSICKKILFTILIVLSTCAAFGEPGVKAKKVFTVLLEDTAGKEAWLPYIGEYPLLIIYEDFRCIGYNKELYNRIKNDKSIADKIKIIHILNMVPVWHTPDFLISRSLQKAGEIYPGVISLLDRRRGLQIKWRLLDSNEKSVLIIIKRDSEIEDVRYNTPDKNAIEKIEDKLRGTVKN